MSSTLFLVAITAAIVALLLLGVQGPQKLKNVMRRFQSWDEPWFDLYAPITKKDIILAAKIAAVIALAWLWLNAYSH